MSRCAIRVPGHGGTLYYVDAVVAVTTRRFFRRAQMPERIADLIRQIREIHFHGKPPDVARLAQSAEEGDVVVLSLPGATRTSYNSLIKRFRAISFTNNETNCKKVC